MKQKTKTINEMATADELLAVVAEIRERVKNLPEEEQEKYYQTDKKEDEQLGDDIKDDDAKDKPQDEPNSGETPPADNGGNDAPQDAPADAPPAKEGDAEGAPNPTADNPPPQDEPAPPDDGNPPKGDMLAVLLEIRDLLQGKSPETNPEPEPKTDDELDKPIPTDEEEAYEDEDFFK